MRTLKSVVSAAVIALMLVVSVDYLAFAATGKSMILGKSNKANKATKLTRTTSGPAMQFNVKNGKGAPIKVNSKGRVGKLNADMVDSKHASDLGVRTIEYVADVDVASASSIDITIPAVPAGTYLATVDAWLYHTTTTGVECRLAHGGGRMEHWTEAGSGGFVVLNGAAIIDVPTTGDLTWECFGGDTSSWTDYNGFHLSFTDVDSLTPATGTTARPKLTRAPGAGAAAR